MTSLQRARYVPTRRLFLLLGGLTVIGLAGVLLQEMVTVWILTFLLAGTMVARDIYCLRSCRTIVQSSQWDQQPTIRQPLGFSLLLQLEAPPQTRYRIEAIQTEILSYRSEPDSLEEPGGGSLRVTWNIVPRKRGDCLWPGAYVVWRGKLGLFERWESLPEVTIPIYPQLTRDLVNKLNPEILMEQFGMKISRRYKADQEFESLRPYESGDDYRHIDWKASARRQQYISRQFRVEHHHQILICLDISRLMGTRLQNISKLDWAIDACLHLAYLARRFEDKIGLLVFSNRVEHWITPKSDPIQPFLKTLYNLDCRLVEADFYQTCMAIMTRQRKRSLVIFLSDFLDAGSMEPWLDVFTYLNRKHCTLFIGLEDPAYRRHMELDPSEEMTAADITRSLVAVDSMKRRIATLNRLRQLGLHALTVTPEELVPRVMAAYREIKLQGAI